MSQTIGLTGYAGSGKDTAAEALLAIGWERRAFADPLRDGLLALDPLVCVGDGRNEGYVRLSYLVRTEGWDNAKRQYGEVRRLLQVYGTEAGRNIHGQDCWIKAARATMLPGVDYVFTDVRFPNEVEMIHQAGGIVIRIDRTGVEAVNAHVSDDIGGLLVDFVIVNDGSVARLHNRLLSLVS